VILLFKKQSRTGAIALATAALFLALCFLKQRTIIIDERGDPHAIVGYGSGYWMWLSSISLVLVAVVVTSTPTRLKKAPDESPIVK
jgi:hypothetical protein